MEEAVSEAKMELSLNTTDLTEVRFILEIMCKSLNEGPRSRERSLVVTKLQEASMWAGEGLRVE
jgi:hypothetical protein